MSSNDSFDPAAHVAQAIDATGVAEVVRDNSAAGRIAFLCRVHKKRIWCDIVEYILTRQNGWTDHICQQYFLRGGRLVFGWNVIIQPTEEGSDEAVAREVARLIIEGASIVVKMAPRGHAGPVEEFPLMGASPRRTSRIVFDPRQPGPSQGGPSHKGAYGIRTPGQD